MIFSLLVSFRFSFVCVFLFVAVVVIIVVVVAIVVIVVMFYLPFLSGCIQVAGEGTRPFCHSCIPFAMIKKKL